MQISGCRYAGPREPDVFGPDTLEPECIGSRHVHKNINIWKISSTTRRYGDAGRGMTRYPGQPSTIHQCIMNLKAWHLSGSQCDACGDIDKKIQVPILWTYRSIY